MSQPLTLTLTRKTPRLSISLGILLTLLLLALPFLSLINIYEPTRPSLSSSNPTSA